MTSVTLSELTVESRDGDWGAELEFEDSQKFALIRGTDFNTVRLRKTDDVPRRFLPNRTSARRTLIAGDILIETAGGSPKSPTGRTMLVTQEILDCFAEPVSCASFARFIRVDPLQADAGYVQRVLQGLYLDGILESYQVQHTGVARFQYTTFSRTHRLTLPPLNEQHSTAELLGALDDKIAANTALIQSADDLMRLTFANMPKDIRIPLSSIALFINGRAFTKDASGTGRVVVRIAELNNGISGSTVHADIEIPERHLARPGDILFAWSGSLTLHRWFHDEAIVNQHIFKVVPNHAVPHWLAFELIRHKLHDFREIAADKATTMGHIQRHHLDEMVGTPSQEAIAGLNPLMDALWHTALNAERENLTLAALRDSLLPGLMSGKLRVRDAEDAAGEVL